jgi:multisubunit Na+/H+ antiporter MnhB subunit
MYRIRKLKTLLAIIAGLIIAIFGIWTFARLGLIKMIFGENIATQNIYPMLDMILGILATIAIVVILVLIVMAIISYIKYHGKPEEPSEELVAIRELIEEIDLTPCLVSPGIRILSLH